MKRFTPAFLFAALLGASLSAQTLVWTGTGVDVDGLPVGSGTGWQGEVTPVGNGTENVYLGQALNTDILLPTNFALNTVTLAYDDEFRFSPLGASATLTLTGGLAYGGNVEPGALVFGPNVTVAVPTTQILDAGINTVVVSGQVTGAGNLTLKSMGAGAAGSFIFNNNGAGNSNTGAIALDFTGGVGTVAFWNSSPFGTGTVSIARGASLVAHGTQTLANSFVLNTATPSTPISLRSWDDVLTLSGGITLANNTNLNLLNGFNSVEFAQRTGSALMAGALQRNPVVISGNIGESGGARALNVGGPGLLILSGTNSYTGGTTVGGSLIFANNGAIPSGSNNVTVNASGYVGLGDLTPGNFATQMIAHVAKGSSGSVGVDTLPGNGTIPFSDPINLSATGTGAIGFTNAGLRIGTATVAVLTGGITPTEVAGGRNYAFGGGGGTLFVQTSLGDAAGNGTFYTGRGLVVSNTGAISLNVPLKVYLQGTNTYSGSTNADYNGGVVIFDGTAPLTASMPSTTANINIAAGGGSSTLVGNNYVGFTDYVASIASPTNPMGAAEFLSKFNKANSWGIIGFDTHSTNSTVDISSAINLTGFNDGVYLGTMTRATLSGAITPSTVTNVNQTANTLRFTAGNGGTLTLNTDLGSGDTTRKVVYGAPGSSSNLTGLSNGTVVLPVANTYTGGTVINANTEGLVLAVGNSAALGTGGITINSSGSGNLGFSATNGAVDLGNAITFAQYANLDLLGANNFTLSGAISGSGTIFLQRNLTDVAGAATLGGNNSGFDGLIGVQHGNLTLTHNNATGTGNLVFFDASATVTFAGAATAPVIHGIDGDKGSLVVPNGTLLTFDTSDDDRSTEFGGVISGAGGSNTSAALAITSPNGAGNTMYLHGHNKYTGGTTITGPGVLGLGYSDSAGTGPITLNLGGLILNAGVTLTNPLVFNSGALAGIGTYAPASISGTGQSAGTIKFGANQVVYAGVPSDDVRFAGTLTFQPNIAFANGGAYHVFLQHPTGTGQHSLLVTNGTLDLSLLSMSGFLIELETIDAAGQSGFANAFVIGQNYQIPIVQAAAITGTFNAGLFSIDATDFQEGMMPSTIFSLSADATHLYLNFTPVPEPSTWALLVTGAGLLGFAARRRRFSRGR